MIYIKLLFMAFFWASAYISTRVTVMQVEPIVVAALRFFFASIILVLILSLQNQKPARLTFKQWGYIVILGISGILLYNVFFALGLKYVEAGRSAVIIAITPLVTAGVAMWLLGEARHWHKVFGMLLGLSAALVVITQGNLDVLLGRRIGWGEQLLMLGVIVWTIYSVCGRVVMRTVPPLVATTYAMIIGTFLLMLCAAPNLIRLEFIELSATGWLHIANLSVLSTAVGYLWFYQGIQEVGATQASYFINAVPVFAVIMGALFLDEAIDRYILFGLLLVILGFLLMSYERLIKWCQLMVKRGVQ